MKQFLLFILFGMFAYGQTNTMSAGTTWESGTWSLGHVPTSSEDAVITSGLTVTINSAAVCRNLSVGTSTNSSTQLSVNGASYSLAVSGYLSVNASNQTGTFSLQAGAGSVSVADTVWLSGSGTSQLTVSTGSITLTKSTGITIRGGTLSVTGTGSISCTGLLTQSGGTISVGSTGTLNADGGLTTNGGTVSTVSGSSISISGTFTNSTSLTFSTGSTVTKSGGSISNSGTLTFSGLTISSSVTTSSSFSIAGTLSGSGSLNASAGTITKSGGSISTSGSLTFSGLTITSIVTTASSFTVTGTLTVSGTLSASAGTITKNGGSISNSGSLTFSGLTITSSVTTSSSFTVAGSLTVTGSLNASAGTVTMTGGSISNSMGLLFYGLTISGSVTTTSSFSISGDLTVGGSGTFYASGGTITKSGGTISNSGVLTFYALTIYSSSFVSTSSSFLVGSTLTVNGTLSASGGTITQYGSIVNNSSLSFYGLTIPSGATVSTSSSFSVSSMNVSGTFNANAGSVSVYGSISNSGSLSFYGLTIPSGATVSSSSSFSVGGALTVNGTFSPSGTVSVYSSITNNGSLSFNTLSIGTLVPSTVTTSSSFAAGAITVSSGSTFTASAGTISIQSTITNNGTLTFFNLTIGNLIPVSTSSSFSVAGAFTVNSSGTFTASAGTITFSGGNAAFTNNGSCTLKNVTLSKSAGSALTLAHTLTVSGVLTLTSGSVSTGSNMVDVTGSGASNVVATGGIVNGKIRRALAANTSTYLFNDASTSIAHVSGTNASSITVESKKNTSLPYGSSSNAVKRYYIITATGGSGTWSLSLSYRNAAGGSDVSELNSLTEADLKLFKGDGSAWTQITSAQSSTANPSNSGKVTATVSEFSDWTFGVNFPSLVTTGSASSVGGTSATMNGTVNANGVSADVRFLYGTVSGTYTDSVTAAESPVTGNSATSVSAVPAGLIPNTLYYFRVIGTNANGYIRGSEQNFTTLQIPPAVSTSAATSITEASAVANGTVNANGSATTVYFLSGTSSGVYTDSVAAAQSPVNGTANTSVSAALTSLTTNTTYYFCAAANNAIGYARGSEYSFTPQYSEPTIASSMNNLSVSATTTTIRWINGNGSSHIVLLKQSSAVNSPPVDGTTYSADSAFGSGTQIGSGNYVVAIRNGVQGAQDSVSISALQPGTLYHFAVYEFNGSAGVQNYLVSSSLTGNFTSTNTGSSSVLSFDGSNDVVSVPASASINLSAGTWEAWVKINSLAHHHRIIFKEGSDYNGKYELYILGGGFNGSFRADAVVGGTRFTATAAEITAATGTWYHTAATYDSTTLKIYINGILRGTTVVSGSPAAISANTGPLGIGGNVNGTLSSTMEGMIDEVRIWNSVKTQSEISADMNNDDLSPSSDGLQAYFHFDQGTAEGDNTSLTALYDATSNANNGTFNNFALTGSSSNFIASDNALPVELVSFTITARGMNAELKWRTATETNNHGFEVERREVRGSGIEESAQITNHNSQNSNQNWLKIGFVEGNGNSNVSHEYVFNHHVTSEGKYAFRLKQIDRDGSFSYSPAVEVTVGSVPKVFALEQNYPNPFNPSTTIGFTLQQSGPVTLKIYDAIGREVVTLVNEELEAGVYHQKTFDAMRFASGMYLARLVSGNNTQIKRLLLLK